MICGFEKQCEQSEKGVYQCRHCKYFKNLGNEVWLNIYEENGKFWTSGMLYKTSKQARTNLCNKGRYYCTINVTTGERITKPLPKKKGE